MQKLLLVLLLMGSSASYAQSDYSVTLDITGLSSTGNGTVDILELDLDLGSKFIALHGAITYTNGDSSLATGTCRSTTEGGVVCNFLIDQNSYTLELDPDLSGDISFKRTDGTTADSGTAVVIAVL